MIKIKIVDLSKNTGNVNYILGENQHLNLIFICFTYTDCTIQIKLNGQNAQADIFGIIIGDKNTLVNIKTIQHHQAPNTRSNLLIKSVLSGQAKFNFEGLIRVEKTGQKTDAYQKNANLLISETAGVETKPVLEILADDVKCTHGATTGNIDGEQLFYLQNRGISEINAKKLLVQGFFQEIIEKINDDKIKEEIINKINLLRL